MQEEPSCDGEQDTRQMIDPLRIDQEEHELYHDSPLEGKVINHDATNAANKLWCMRTSNSTNVVQNSI